MAYSYSDIDTFGRCPAMYYWRVIRDIERKVTAQELKLGTLVHRLLAGEFKNEPAYDILHAEIMEDPVLWDDEKAEQASLLDEAMSIVYRYLAEYDDEWEVLHVEESFETTIGDSTFSYTPDLIVRDPHGNVWIVDHKTTKDSAPKELPQADLQAVSYAAAVKERYPELAGFIFNYLRKKVPTVPRLNKTGPKKVNNLTRIDTTYDILYAFCEENDLLDDPEHRKRLAELRDENRFYFRQYVYLEDVQMEKVQDDLAGRIGMIEWSTTQGRFPRTMQTGGMRGCERCSYNQVCFGDMLGHDVEMILDEYYKEREHN